MQKMLNPCKYVQAEDFRFIQTALTVPLSPDEVDFVLEAPPGYLKRSFVFVPAPVGCVAGKSEVAYLLEYSW